MDDTEEVPFIDDGVEVISTALCPICGRRLYQSRVISARGLRDFRGERIVFEFDIAQHFKDVDHTDIEWGRAFLSDRDPSYHLSRGWPRG